MVTLIRVILITPYIVFDDQATSLLIAGALLNYTVKLYQGKLQESLMKQAGWTSGIALLAIVTLSIIEHNFPEAQVAVLNYRASVRFERAYGKWGAIEQRNRNADDAHSAERRSMNRVAP